MPAIREKQFRVICPAASNTPSTSVQASPAIEGRSQLFIMNTGANPGLIHFQESVQGDGSDIVLAVNAWLQWDQASTCPRSKVNMGSILGTTFAVFEQVTA